jgi:hypothetical protein
MSPHHAELVLIDITEGAVQEVFESGSIVFISRILLIPELD